MKTYRRCISDCLKGHRRSSGALQINVNWVFTLLRGGPKTSTLSVRIEPSKVAKQLIPTLCVIEAERTRAALAVAKQHDIFVVPRTIELGAASGQLILEYLSELTHPLDRSIVLSGRRTVEYRQIGQAVACRHANLDVSYTVAHGTRIGDGGQAD